MKKLLIVTLILSYCCFGMETVEYNVAPEETAAEESSKEAFYKKYPNVFDNFQPKYKEIIYDYIKDNNYKKSLLNLQLITPDMPDAKKKGNIFAWAAIADYFDLAPYVFSGYINFLNPNSNKKIMQGERPSGTPFNLLDFINLGTTEQNCQKLYKMSCQKAKEMLAGLYKIHLMPKEHDFNTVVTMFFEELQKNHELQNVLESFKIVQNPSINEKVLLEKGSELVMPLVVLYPAGGQENAQKLLTLVSKLYQIRSGSGITPRYNRRITSLIYYAQGDADHKKPITEKYFEPDFVHYIADFTGKPENYYLQSRFIVKAAPESRPESHKRKEPETAEAGEKASELKSLKGMKEEE